jgi:rubrerythrin
MYKTESNLQTAFAGESQAYMRYTFFAMKSESEGLPMFAKLFRAAAAAEMVHARNHFQVMGGIGTIRENLLAAATTEHLEITRVYPGFIEQAIEERNERARVSFTYADKAEQVHNKHFEKALETVKAGQKIEDAEYFVCNSCGNLVTREAPAKCPICGSGAGEFKKTE